MKVVGLEQAWSVCGFFIEFDFIEFIDYLSSCILLKLSLDGDRVHFGWDKLVDEITVFLVFFCECKHPDKH